MNLYSNKTWLTKNNYFTSSVVAFFGPSPWNEEEANRKVMFLEISDCHGKIKLHKGEKETIKHFITKLEKLRNEIDKFISFLNKL